MKLLLYLLVTVGCLPYYSAAQSVGIGTAAPHASAMLDISSNNKGLLPPRMTWTEIQAIASPAAGLVVFDMNIQALRLYSGSRWVVLGTVQKDLNDAPGYVTSGMISGTSQAIQPKVKMLPDGSAIVVGSFGGTIDFPVVGSITATSAVDIFIAKYDALGNPVWVKSFGGPNPAQDIAINNDVQTDAAGNILICGYFYGDIDLNPAGTDLHTSAGSYDVYFAKYDPAGNWIWGRHFGGMSEEWISAICTDGSSNIYLGGYFSATLDFDPSVAASTLNSFGSTDMFLSKFDPAGNFLFVKQVGGTSPDSLYDIVLRSSGLSMAVVGKFAGTADFDPTVTVNNLVSAGSDDGFLGVYDLNGNLTFIGSIGGTGTDEIRAVAAGSDGATLFAGSFTGTADLNIGTSVSNYTSAGGKDGFAARIFGFGVIWSRPFGGTADDYATDIKTNPSNEAYVSGKFYSPVFSCINANMTNYGGGDAFILKIGNQGDNLQWMKKAGGRSGFYDNVYNFDMNTTGTHLFIPAEMDLGTFIGFDGQRVDNYYHLYVLYRYEE
jgi:hypothetical protein